MTSDILLSWAWEFLRFLIKWHHTHLGFDLSQEYTFTKFDNKQKWFLRQHFCELWNIDLLWKSRFWLLCPGRLLQLMENSKTLEELGCCFPEFKHHKVMLSPSKGLDLVTSHWLYKYYTMFIMFTFYSLILIFTSTLQETLNLSLWSKWLNDWAEIWIWSPCFQTLYVLPHTTQHPYVELF